MYSTTSNQFSLRNEIEKDVNQNDGSYMKIPLDSFPCSSGFGAHTGQDLLEKAYSPVNISH